jgi:hypothetical protein
LNEGVQIMTRFANRKPVRTIAAAASLAVCLLLATAAGSGAVADNATQTPAVAPAQSAQGTQPAAAGAPAANTPTTQQQASPAFRPGFLHQLKSWWDDSLAVFDRKDATPRDAGNDVNKKAEDTSPGVADRAKDAAASAVTSTQDAMRSAVEATKGAASTAVEVTKGAASTAVEATKNAANAIVRLPNTRVIQVNEPCVRAPNGGSDCATAAANGCRAKGFAGGTPLDVRTGSRCDPNPPQAGQMPTVRCSSESVVTRAVCQ